MEPTIVFLFKGGEKKKMEKESKSLAIKTAEKIMAEKNREVSKKRLEDEKKKKNQERALEFLEELNKLQKESEKNCRFVFSDGAIIIVKRDEKINDRIDTNLFFEGKKFNLLIKLGERTRIDGLNDYYKSVMPLIEQEITNIEFFKMGIKR